MECGIILLGLSYAMLSTLDDEEGRRGTQQDEEKEEAQDVAATRLC